MSQKENSKEYESASISSKGSIMEEPSNIRILEEDKNEVKETKSRANQTISLVKKIHIDQEIIINDSKTTRKRKSTYTQSKMHAGELKENLIKEIIENNSHANEIIEKLIKDLEQTKHDLKISKAAHNDSKILYDEEIKSLKEEIQSLKEQVFTVNNDEINDLEFPVLKTQTLPPKRHIPSKMPVNKIKEKDEHVIIIDTKDENGAKSYRDASRANKKEIFTTNTPNDLIISRPNRLILKMKNRTDLDQVKNNIIKSNLNTKGEIKTNKLIKNKIILFGIPNDYEEKEKKLQEDIENLELMENHKIEIFKIFKSKNGELNGIIQVDNYIQAKLLEKKKILLDLVRIRVAKYINLAICYNCQNYGHISKFCKNKKSCAICSGDHDSRQCTITQNPTCKHCHENRNHRSDSYRCPTYLQGKQKIINYGQTK